MPLPETGSANTRRPIEFVNEDFPLTMLHKFPRESSPVIGIALSDEDSDCASLLAAFCSGGIVRIYDLQTFSLLATLRDPEEREIEEFFCGTFIPGTSLLAVAGKTKDRHSWCDEEDDNRILPCSIKIFDLLSDPSSFVVCRLTGGHEEEVLAVKAVRIRQENFIISCGQDGYACKWRMSNDWRRLDGTAERLDDHSASCLVFSGAFLQRNESTFFISARDDGIKIHKIDSGEMVASFDESHGCAPAYSSYCDDVLIVPTVAGEPAAGDLPALPNSTTDVYLLSRGVELVHPGDVTRPLYPNKLCLHRLGKSESQEWQLELLCSYSHPAYHSNSWYVRIASNGRYVFAPSCDGKIFIFALGSSTLAGVLCDHEDYEVRQALLHPIQPLLFTCGDDGNIFVYGYAD